RRDTRSKRDCSSDVYASDLTGRIIRMEESSMPHNGESRMARRKQKQKISKKNPFWKKLLLSIAVVFLLAGIGVGGVFAYYIATAPTLVGVLLNNSFSSNFIDKD